jgi:glycosyltransferase involved in cell wall biosynthesis
MNHTTSTNNKILIIDSGMKNLGGHNFSYTRAVQNALLEKGFEVDVFANKLLPDELAKNSGYKPFFSQGAYDFPPFKGIKRDLPHIYAQSIIYADELEAELENKLSDYAAIFCHTIGDFEIIGWNRFLSRNKLNSHLFLLLRWTQKFKGMSFIKQKIHPFFRIKPYYLNSIYAKLKNKFTLVTDSELLTEDFNSIYKHRIVTLPIPLNKYFLASEKDVSSSLNKFRNHYHFKKKGLCIGYMGDARQAKGFHLLPDLVRNVLEKTENVYFAFQCPKSASGNDYSDLPKGVPELREIAATNPDRLILISERLSEEDYANMFRCLDIVLIPYLLPNYQEATSGIFAEAVALGKPTIVTVQTWMAHELKKFGGGLEIKSDNINDLTEKVFELIEHYEKYQEKTENFSSQWCQFHNSLNLAEMLAENIKKSFL